MYNYVFSNLGFSMAFSAANSISKSRRVVIMVYLSISQARFPEIDFVN